MMDKLRFRAHLKGTESTVDKEGKQINSDSQAFGSDLVSMEIWAKEALSRLGARDKLTASVNIYETQEEHRITICFPMPYLPGATMQVTDDSGFVVIYRCLVCGQPNCTRHSQQKPNRPQG